MASRPAGRSQLAAREKNRGLSNRCSVHSTLQTTSNEPGAKSARRGKRAGMQLRIAARQPAAIAGIGRRLVSEGREGNDLRPRTPPSFDDMRIDECKGGIASQRDALARLAEMLQGGEEKE